MKHYLDIQGTALGAIPLGMEEGASPAAGSWEVVADATSPDGKVIRCTTTQPVGTVLRAGLFWSGLGNLLDTEVFCLARFNVGSLTNDHPAVARWNGVVGYSAYARAGADRAMGVRTQGVPPMATVSILTPEGIFDFSANIWYGFVLRVIGNTIRAEFWVWDSGQADFGRAAAVVVEGVDAEVVGTGLAGLAFSMSSTRPSRDVARFSVGTDGDSAPMSPLQPPSDPQLNILPESTEDDLLVSWISSVDPEGEEIIYRVESSADSGLSWSLVEETSATEINLLVDLFRGGSVRVRVRAIDSDGMMSGWSESSDVEVSLWNYCDDPQGAWIDCDAPNSEWVDC